VYRNISQVEKFCSEENSTKIVKTVWPSLKKLNPESPYASVVPPRHRLRYLMAMLTTALFTVAKSRISPSIRYW
jgi:hypothetical protein